MDKALKLAENAYEAGEVPVGCVFVHEGQVIGQGWNQPNKTLNATRHAEIVAIDQIIEQYGSRGLDLLRQSDLYVTVEPCIMCASALKQVGVRKVYFGCHNERFGGNGSVLSLHECHYEIEYGSYRREAITLLRRFYLRENDSAPQPKRKNNRVLKEVKD